MEGLATVLGGHAHMHMGRMEKKLVGVQTGITI